MESSRDSVTRDGFIQPIVRFYLFKAFKKSDYLAFVQLSRARRVSPDKGQRKGRKEIGIDIPSRNRMFSNLWASGHMMELSNSQFENEEVTYNTELIIYLTCSAWSSLSSTMPERRCND